MQIDMHYYGTYALARAAGVGKDAAKIIATAAQFVDDNTKNDETGKFDEVSRICYHATGHHSWEGANLDEIDQRHVWVPFHFLPGNEGTSISERLVCRKNSNIVKAMVEHNTSKLDHPYQLEIVGITAHVYTDTFAHYGFSGISSSRNIVDIGNIELLNAEPKTTSYLQDKLRQFPDKYPSPSEIVDKVKATIAQSLSGALGHGAVATFPDLPYLNWVYETVYPEKIPVPRNNQDDFFDGAMAIYSMFQKFLEFNPEH